MNEKAAYWWGMVDYDLAVAKTMLRDKRYLYVGFMCHLAIEKSLKAVIVNTQTPPKIHDLTRLAILAGLYDVMSDAQKDFLEVLTPLCIEARYPAYKEALAKELNQARCKVILQETEELRIWIKEQF